MSISRIDLMKLGCNDFTAKITITVDEPSNPATNDSSMLISMVVITALAFTVLASKKNKIKI